MNSSFKIAWWILCFQREHCVPLNGKLKSVTFLQNPVWVSQAHPSLFLLFIFKTYLKGSDRVKGLAGGERETGTFPTLLYSVDVSAVRLLSPGSCLWCKNSRWISRQRGVAKQGWFMCKMRAHTLGASYMCLRKNCAPLSFDVCTPRFVLSGSVRSNVGSSHDWIVVREYGDGTWFLPFWVFFAVF